MPIQQTLHESRVPVHIWTDDVDAASKRQLANIAKLPCVFEHVAAMPDVHLGLGATIGSVIATKNAIIPAAVGVDLGCGMVACRLSLSANEVDEVALQRIFDQITQDIPVGRGTYNNHRAFEKEALLFEPGLQEILRRHPDLAKTMCGTRHWVNQLGTLGGGNHFIEVCLDESDQVWLMLHSGSRGVGNVLASYFIELAKRDMERWMIQLPDRDLAYIPEGCTYFQDYVLAVKWAQDYAMENRRCMLTRAIAALRLHLPAFEVTSEVVNCHHNYVEKEHHFGDNVWVTRKGAIRARSGELGLIPGSMGARSYVVRGLGNPMSFHSSAHGAGRRMSRTQAQKAFSAADLAAQTQGVICRKDEGVVDEIPSAYKDIDAVMAHQRDLTETLHTLKQILCVKG
jgi:tRNA-splicing ligase RtcB